MRADAAAAVMGVGCGVDVDADDVAVVVANDDAVANDELAFGRFEAASSNDAEVVLNVADAVAEDWPQRPGITLWFDQNHASNRC